MLKGKKIFSKWLYWFTFGAALIILYKVMDNFSGIKSGIADLLGVLMPFIFGIIISYILYVPVKKLEVLFGKAKKLKIIKKKARGLAVVIVYVMAIITLVLFTNYVIPLIINSLLDFVNNFQNYYSIIMEKINSLPEDSFIKGEVVKSIIQKIGEIDMSAYINMEQVTKYAQGALNIASGIFDFFVSIIVSAYILLERGEIIKFFKKLFNAIFEKETCKRLGGYFNRTNDIFLKFLASQLLDAIVVGILTSIAMSILGVKYAVLLGVMIGLFNMIPYFGAIVAVIIATVITFITGGLSQAIWMVITTTILQQIDANIINPKIVGESLKISPLLVIFAVTIGGAYFGVLGMFLAVPVAAILKVLIGDFIDIKMAQKIKENDIENSTEKCRYP